MSANEGVVLLVAGDSEVSATLKGALKKRGYTVLVATNTIDAVRELVRGRARLVVLVLPLANTTGKELINDLKSVDGGLVFVVLGSDSEVKNAQDAFDLGAQDYMADPLHDTSEFLSSVGVVLGSRRGDRHLSYLRAKDSPGHGWQTIIGDSPGLKRVVSTLEKVCKRMSAGNSPTILISGEAGTGKGFLAKCIHYNGARRTRPFVEINCAAVPPSSMESELFGAERAAVADVMPPRAGLFETADGGTLFLDEIGAVPLELQAKLLRAIEDKIIRRIGARHPNRVDVQIIAATHENLHRRVAQRSFRADLFQRLNVVSVSLPSLRERGSDVIALGSAFLSSICSEYGMPARRLSDEAKSWMMHYSWPGNVRELRNQIERIVLLESGEEVLAEHFAIASDGVPRVSIAPGSKGSKLRVTLPPSGISLVVLEQEVIREALNRCDGNVSRAARYLSISRQTLLYRIKKYRLSSRVKGLR